MSTRFRIDEGMKSTSVLALVILDSLLMSNNNFLARRIEPDGFEFHGPLSASLGCDSGITDPILAEGG